MKRKEKLGVLESFHTEFQPAEINIALSWERVVFKVSESSEQSDQMNSKVLRIAKIRAKCEGSPNSV